MTLFTEHLTDRIFNNNVKYYYASAILPVSHSYLTKQDLLAQIVAQFVEKQ